ncbi:MAG: hypothetical protein Q9218_000678 [Villophora microphyllina]
MFSNVHREFSSLGARIAILTRRGSKILMPPVSHQGAKARPSQINNKKRGLGLPNSQHPGLLNSHPPKRRKTNDGTVREVISRTGASIDSEPVPTLDVSHGNKPPILSSLPAEIRHFEAQYRFSTVTVISSSKIQQKVNGLLACVEKPRIPNAAAKTGIAIIEAKAAAAAKLISILEIAKAEISKRNGEWYQYSSLRAELLPHKVKQKKPSQGLQASNDHANAQDMSNDTSSRHQLPTQKIANVGRDMEGDDSDDEAAAFEILQSHPAADTKLGKVRTTPIMTVYFSCESVSSLKDLLG